MDGVVCSAADLPKVKKLLECFRDYHARIRMLRSTVPTRKAVATPKDAIGKRGNTSCYRGEERGDSLPGSGTISEEILSIYPHYLKYLGFFYFLNTISGVICIHAFSFLSTVPWGTLFRLLMGIRYLNFRNHCSAEKVGAEITIVRPVLCDTYMEN